MAGGVAFWNLSVPHGLCRGMVPVPCSPTAYLIFECSLGVRIGVLPEDKINASLWYHIFRVTAGVDLRYCRDQTNTMLTCGYSRSKMSIANCGQIKRWGASCHFAGAYKDLHRLNVN